MKWTRIRRSVAAGCVIALAAGSYGFTQQLAPEQAAVQTARVDAPAIGNLNEHPLTRPVELAKQSLDKAKQLQDCSFIMVKRELINGKLNPHDAVLMKIRCRPFAVYVQTLGPVQPKGREAIYAEGRNNGKALVHVTGFQHKLVGMLQLDPTGPEMMDGQRYPMTLAGYENFLAGTLQLYQAEAQGPAQENKVQIYVGAKVDGRPCTCVENSHPVKRDNYPFQMTRIFYDDEHGLPIRWEAYAWPSRPGEQPPLLEEYTYRNLRLNVGLTDADFDANNPAYAFK